MKRYSLVPELIRVIPETADPDPDLAPVED